MQIIKRNGKKEDIKFDKILTRVQALSLNLKVEPVSVAQRVVAGLVDGISSTQVDGLLAETAAALTVDHPDYGILAAKIAVSALHKNTTGFYSTMKLLYKEGLIADDFIKTLKANGQKIEAMIDYERDFRFDYFGFKTLEKGYLQRVGGRVVERPQHMYMRVALGIAGSDLKAVKELYDLMSLGFYTHATPTLYNAGTRNAQMSSCYLVKLKDDSIAGIFDTIKDCAMISKYAGGIGVSVSNVRADNSKIKGINGQGNGLIPFLKVFNETARAVNQCFAPETLIYTADGVKPISEAKVGDLVLGSSGSYCSVLDVLDYRQDGPTPMVEVKFKHAIQPLQVTAGHPFWAMAGVPMEQSIARTIQQIEAGRYTPAWVEAGALRKGDYVAQVVPTEIVPAEGLTEEDARLYGVLLGDGHLSGDDMEWGVSGNPTKDEHLDFVRSYLKKAGVHFWENHRGDTFTQVRWSFGRGVRRDEVSGRILGMGSPTTPFTRADIYDEKGCKRIARRFSHLPFTQTREMLRGLLETDGCVSRGVEISFTNTSAPLIEGLRYQLLRLGVPAAGQYRERKQDHEGHRSDGTVATFKGTVKAYDLRIPAVPEIAALVGCKPLTKRNWLNFGGCVWTRVLGTREIATTPVVYDLKVEGDETYQTAAALVHNGGRRKGAFAMYLEPWHADVEAFLDLKKSTGKDEVRARDLYLALWVPDLFMQRVQDDGLWTLMSPDECPGLQEAVGDDFKVLYERYEAEGRGRKVLKARELMAKIIEAQIETGVPYIGFKDAANRKSNQKNLGTILSSNLCIEVIEFSSADETAVCNLASLALSRFVEKGRFDFDGLGKVVQVAIRNLNRVIDLNFYPTPETKKSNLRHRPVGLGVQGLADTFIQMKMPFESTEAMKLNRDIFETMYYFAVKESVELAKAEGAYETFKGSPASEGKLQYTLWGVTPSDRYDWKALESDVVKYGLRNSLLIAVMPTASTASVLGNNEGVEAITSNIYKRQVLSGEFAVVNKYLVQDLEALGLWDKGMRDRILGAGGSIQDIPEIPQAVRDVYKTVWEIKQRTVIDQAAERGPFVCQSQSMNLWFAKPSFGGINSAVFHAWKQGLKTGVYYTRTQPATQAVKVTTPTAPQQVTDGIACSIKNPEACEMCSA